MEKRKNITSYVVVIALLAFAASIFLLTGDWKAGSVDVGFGAGFYPQMLAIILIVLTVILFFEDRIKERKSRKAAMASAPAEESHSEEGSPSVQVVNSEGGSSVETENTEEEAKFTLSKAKYPAIFFGMMILYTLLLNVFGFVADTIIFLFSGMMLLKGKLLNCIIISVLFTAVIYFLFGYLLKVQLPAGMIFGG